MKKSILIFFTIFFINMLFSQSSGVVEYDYKKRLGMNYETTGILYYNSWSSNFVELKNNHEAQKNYDDDGKIKISTSNGNIRPQNYFNKKNNTLFSTEIFLGEKYIVEEKIPQLKWQLQQSTTKLIDTFLCQQATTYFRGRNYIAWFTTAIPISFGPWKLQGLPGLILEVYDTDKEIYFLARKITFKQEPMIKVPEIKNQIKIKEFIHLKKEKYKEKSEIIASKMPRNAKFKFTPPPRGSQKEIIYEWEESKED